MHGNAWEWCKDWYKSNYYTICGDCIDPLGPDTGSSRTWRGGGWTYNASFCRSAYRGSIFPSDTHYNLGFRIALVKD